MKSKFRKISDIIYFAIVGMVIMWVLWVILAFGSPFLNGATMITIALVAYTYGESKGYKRAGGDITDLDI